MLFQKPVEPPPYFLWGMLAMAVCVMLAIVLRAMTTMNREDGKYGRNDDSHGEEE